LVINIISTCFGHFYAHHQDIQLRQAVCTVWRMCTQLATRLSSITTATTGQTNIGSGTQLDLLMMGIKMTETC